MPVKLTPRGDATGITWDSGAGVERIEHGAVPGSPGSKEHQEAMQAALQAGLDARLAIDELPADDPDKTADPGRGTLYHGDSGGEKVDAPTHLISRAVAVTLLAWDGKRYICETRRVR